MLNRVGNANVGCSLYPLCHGQCIKVWLPVYISLYHHLFYNANKSLYYFVIDGGGPCHQSFQLFTDLFSALSSNILVINYCNQCSIIQSCHLYKLLLRTKAIFHFHIITFSEACMCVLFHAYVVSGESIMFSILWEGDQSNKVLLISLITLLFFLYLEIYK